MKYAYLKCACGWKSKPYPEDTMFAGVGGQLSCPDCTKIKRNKNLEVCGHVEVVIEEERFNPSKRTSKGGKKEEKKTLSPSDWRLVKGESLK